MYGWKALAFYSACSSMWPDSRTHLGGSPGCATTNLLLGNGLLPARWSAKTSNPSQSFRNESMLARLSVGWETGRANLHMPVESLLGAVKSVSQSKESARRTPQNGHLAACVAASLSWRPAN
jgi:hypothetical protein